MLHACCMKARMVMAEKGLDLEIKTVASYAFEYCRSEYPPLQPKTRLQNPKCANGFTAS